MKLDIENIRIQVEKASEKHLENVWSVEYETLVSIFVAGAMWLANEIDEGKFLRD